MCEINILIVTFDVRCSIMYILTQLDCLATICFLFVFSLPVRENQIKLKPEEVQKHENLQTLRFALFLHTLVLYLGHEEAQVLFQLLQDTYQHKYRNILP